MNLEILWISVKNRVLKINEIFLENLATWLRYTALVFEVA